MAVNRFVSLEGEKTFLHNACATGIEQDVRGILAAWHPIDESLLYARDANGLTALHKACLHGNKNTMNLILLRSKKNSRHLYHVDNSGKTALHYACEHQDADTVGALLKRMDPFEESLYLADNMMFTPLHYASASPHIGCARVLLEFWEKQHAVGLYAVDRDGRSALHLACLKGNIDAASSILERWEGDPDLLYATDTSSRTVLHYACMREARKHGTTMLDMLLCRWRDNPMALYIVDTDGMTILHHACQSGDAQLVQSVLVRWKQGRYSAYSLRAKDNEGRTALHWACYCGDEEMVRLINGQAAQGNAESVRLLLTSWEGDLQELYAQDSKGYTALHLACMNSDVGAASLVAERWRDGAEAFEAVTNDGTKAYTLLPLSKVHEVFPIERFGIK